MNFPPEFQKKQSHFVFKIHYSEEECLKMFPELEHGIYDLGHGLILLRIEEFGAMILDDPEVLQKLNQLVNLQVELKTLPPSIALQIREALDKNELVKILGFMREMIKSGFGPELN